MSGSVYDVPILPIFTGRRLDPTEWPAYRAFYIPDGTELCARHGIDAKNTTTVEYDIVDTALLRFECYIRNDKGTAQLWCALDGLHGRDANHDECKVATETIERALIGDLPAWWQPEAAE